jgi:hypothetical protein
LVLLLLLWLLLLFTGGCILAVAVLLGKWGT